MNISLGDAIKEILEDYSTDIIDAVNRVTDETAEELKSEVEETAPTGKRKKLRKSWRLEKEKLGGIDERVTLHSTEYRIVHLVENGHVTKHGTSRARAYHFIQKATDKIMPVYEEAIKEAISNV